MPKRTREEFIAWMRELLSPERQDELLRMMSPEARALDERITKLRDAIGPIDFDVVEELRRMRNGG